MSSHGKPSPENVQRPEGLSISPFRDIAQRTVARPRVPIVGRDGELDILRRRLADVVAERGGLELIGGEAGIGKTALATTLAAEAAEAGARVLVGRCYDRTEPPPYGPWTEIAQQIRADLSVSPAPILPSLDAAPSQAMLFEQVSIDVCGTFPASRSFLCQTPPLARSTVLSIAAARPQAAHGWSVATRCRPRQAICAGKVSGSAARRRSQVRRAGKRPSGSTSSARNCPISAVGWPRTVSNSCALCKWRTIVTASAFANSRSE